MSRHATQGSAEAPPLPHPQSARVTRISPVRGWRSLGLHELWEYRELLYFLSWRDVKVRYKQAVLGVGWAILQPVLTMIVFSVIFGTLAGIPSEGVPYPVFAYAALLPWTFFSTGIVQSSNSTVSGAEMVRKVYLPRMAIPVGAILPGFLDLAIAFVVLIGLMVYYGIVPTANLILLPALILLAFVTATGVGLWLSALSAKYRDVRFMVPFLTQLWLFATPIAYPSSLADEPFRTLLGLNPMSGVVEGFRWALLSTDTAPGPLIALSTVVAIVVLATGLLYFARTERTMADVI